jgi:hypothetical protein
MHSRSIALLLLAVLLVSCSGASPTSTPTATLEPSQVPPTNTSIPATLTPVPTDIPVPTETSIPRTGIGIQRSAAASAFTIWGYTFEPGQDSMGDEVYAGTSKDGTINVSIKGPSDDVWSIDVAIQMSSASSKAEQDRATLALMNTFLGAEIPAEEGLAWVQQNWKAGDYQTEMYGKAVVLNISVGTEMVFVRMAIGAPDGLEALLDSVGETR